MGVIDTPAMPPLEFDVDGNFLAAMVHPHQLMGDRDAYLLADQAPGDLVGIAVHRDGAVGTNPAHEVARGHEGWPVGERAQSMALVAGKTQPRGLTGRTMDPGVGNIAGPGIKMRFHLAPAGEAATGDGILLHVTHAALVLALGPCAIRGTGPHPEAPVPGKRMQPGMQHHLPARGIMVQNQRPGVVEQDLARNAAKGEERAFHPGKPALLLLMAKGTHVQTAGIAERRDEEEHLGGRARDLNAALAEVDLQLLPGGVSKRTVALASAMSSRRSGATARSIVLRLTWMAFSAASSCRITSQLPP